jgi:hypothetical protein
MRIFLIFYFFTFPIVGFSQIESQPNNSSTNDTLKEITKDLKTEKATIDMYRFVSRERDTTYIDTSLTIHREYSFNLLRKDIFGLLPLANVGQPYNTIDFGLTQQNLLPEFGFHAKKFNYLKPENILYGSVATPVTELFFRSTIGGGHLLDSYFTMNFSPNMNVGISYKALRSDGKYNNNGVTSSNFKLNSSYSSDSKRYVLFSNIIFNDISNEENGGIIDKSNFESGSSDFTNRQSIEVYLQDAASLLKSRSFFVDHSFRINPKVSINNLNLNHVFNYENQSNNYTQSTVTTTVNGDAIYRFGDSYVTSSINDNTNFNKMFNQLGLQYENDNLGKFKFFINDFRSNFYYNKILILDAQTIPDALNYTINNIGGNYLYKKRNWNLDATISKSISQQTASNIEAELEYQFNDLNQIKLGFQNLSKIPDNPYSLFQSSYVNYNWKNDFKNELYNSLHATLETQWFNASLNYKIINHFLYFENVATDADQQIVAPKQYDNTINYFSVKINKNLAFNKFGFDNTILFQQVQQADLILNVPQLVTRNTIYYSNHFFKKALFLQTGITFNYFSSFYANEYNPIVGSFFTQTNTKIGNYPLFDVFVNGKIQRTRIYIKAEHINSSFTGYNYYSTPQSPYRDFAIRFGLVWNFFN